MARKAESYLGGHSVVQVPRKQRWARSRKQKHLVEATAEEKAGRVTLLEAQRESYEQRVVTPWPIVRRTK